MGMLRACIVPISMVLVSVQSAWTAPVPKPAAKSVAAAPSAATDVWTSQFAAWVPQALPQAEELARVEMQREADRLAAQHARIADEEKTELDRWLSIRANDLCGCYLPPTGDLFGPVSSGPIWQSLETPFERLAAFAADAGNTATGRREANGAIELFAKRTRANSDRAAMLAPIMRPIGMLMLVP